MKKDRVSMNILENINKQVENKSILTEMPQKLKVNRKVKAYDFRELSPRTQSELSGRDKTLNSTEKAEEKFEKDADLDLKNRLNAIIPNTFSGVHSCADYKGKGLDYVYIGIDYTPFAKLMCNKFSELIYDKDAYGDSHGIYIRCNNDDDFYVTDTVSTFRKVLSKKTNFDELRRQQKTAINNYLTELYFSLQKAVVDNKKEFEDKRSEYDKYINLRDKELEDKLSKYWYDEFGKVLRAKNLDESFIKTYNLKEAHDMDVEDYVEIYDFDELSDYTKNSIAGRKIKAQIQKMGDRMTEIIEEKFTEYMAARGLVLEPGNFSIEELLYNMTHSGRNGYGFQYDCSFKITSSELKSYFENNQDLVEKYGQDLIDQFFAYTYKDKGSYYEGTAFYLNIAYNEAKLNCPWVFKNYEYNRYYKGASKELEDMVKDLEKELMLDFYTVYKVLNKVKDQLENEAKEIIYEKIRNSGDKYLRSGKKYTGQIPSEEDA